VTDSAVRQRANEPGASDDAVHQPEISGASVRLACEHREDDRIRCVEEVRHEDREHDRADQAMPPDEPHSLRELSQEPARRLGVQLMPRSGDRLGDDRGRDDEACSVEPECRRRSEARDEDSPERPADEQRPLLDAGSDPARPLHPHAR
jgi:hypothetical protein